MDTGTILVSEPVPVREQLTTSNVAVSTRVASSERQATLDTQAERLMAYCTVRGYQMSKAVKEIGSRVNENRPQALALLADPSLGRSVIEPKDRGTRCGFCYLERCSKPTGETAQW
jgi:putative resolvase